MRSFLLRAALVVAVLALSVSVVAAQNVLTNPGFEDGLNGWIVFGNAFPESSNPPQFEALGGAGLVSMFGTFYQCFCVSGIFQEFPTTAGSPWQMSSNARYWSGDPMIGGGAPNSNWVVQKIAFFDVGNNEIGAVESTILDATYAADMWHPSGVIVGVAPAGTVKVQALILYLQPNYDGGAAHVDDVAFVNSGVVPVEDSNWGKIKALYGE